MRILVLSNFYPPYTFGGQEQSCQKVVEGLKQRGHQTVVLTSLYGVNSPIEAPVDVHRALHLETDLVAWRQSIHFFTKTRSNEKHNLQVLRNMIKEFDPDIVFIWGMWNISRSVPALAEAMCPGKVVYRFSDYWPTLPSQKESYWRNPGRTWFSRLPKMLLGTFALAILSRSGPPPSLHFENVIFVSSATKEKLAEAGISVSQSSIIHTGINIDPYLKRDTYRQPHSSGMNLLYAGRLLPEKGVDTAIQAISELVKKTGITNIRLNIAGTNPAGYEEGLRNHVLKEGLKQYISFLGSVPNEEMPALLRKNDVLLLPSLWPEPFARIVLEGMISGLVVVATPCGGTTEIVQDEKNGLLFTPGDARDLAQKVSLLINNPATFKSLAEAGQKTVKEYFSFPTMMDQIENFLTEAARSPRSREDAFCRRFSDNPALEPL